MSVVNEQSQRAESGAAKPEKKDSGSGGKVQLKQQLAGLSYSDQVAALAPPSAPVQLKGSGGPAPAGPASEVAQSGFTGPASPIPHRAQMERGFNTDFSAVQCYSGPAAQQANQAMGSQAYAMGTKIGFSSPNPSPAVVAHELAHTIQQTGSSGPQTKSGGGYDSYEAEADHAAATVLSGGVADVQMRNPTGVQFWGGSDHFAMGNLGAQRAMTDFKAANAGALPGRITTGQAYSHAGRTPGSQIRDNQLRVMRECPTCHHRTHAANCDNPAVPAVPCVGTATAEASPDTLTVTTNNDNDQMGFGHMTRAGGDYTRKPKELLDMGDPISPYNETEATFWTRSGRATLDYQLMGRIAGTNINHFYPNCVAEYNKHHALAIDAAARAHANAGNNAKVDKFVKTALLEEGFANHFLQDCFASGHMAPRALDVMGSRGNWVEGGRVKGYNRSKPWHDFFCALPEGLPFSDGNRYHGDYYMSGNDLNLVANATRDSVRRVLNSMHGAAAGPAVAPPHPDFGAIMTDPVAGPAWRLMMGAGTDELSGYGPDKQTAENDDKVEGYTSDGDTHMTKDAILDDMDHHVFGQGQNTAPDQHAVTTAAIHSQLLALQTLIRGTWGKNVHTHEDDELRDRQGEAMGGHFGTVVDIEDKYRLLSNIERTCDRAAAVHPPVAHRAAAIALRDRVRGWKRDMVAIKAAPIFLDEYDPPDTPTKGELTDALVTDVGNRLPGLLVTFP